MLFRSEIRADLGHIAETPHPLADRVQLGRSKLLTQLLDGLEESAPALVSRLPDATKRGKEILGAPRHDPAQIAPESGQMKVQKLLGHTTVAPTASRPETRPETPHVYAQTVLAPAPLLEESESHVEITAGPGRPYQPPEVPLDAADPPALGLLGQKGKRRAKPPAGDPHLVEGLFLAGHGFGELSKERLDALFENSSGSIVGAGHRCQEGPPGKGAGTLAQGVVFHQARGK